MRTLSGNKQYRIPLFCLVTLIFWFSMYTCVPILATYVESLGASHKLSGIIVGAYGFSQMLLRIPVGVASDRFHKRKLFISFGLFFSVLSGLGLWATKDFSWILLSRALAGAAAATWVDFTILFTSYFTREETTKAIGTISFYNSLGQMLGLLTGGWAADWYGWGAAFLLGSAVGTIGLAASFFIVEKFDDNSQKITVSGVLEVAGDRVLLVVSGLAILSQVLTFATAFGFTPVYAHELGASKLDMGLLTFFSNLPAAFASLIGGSLLVNKIGERRIIVYGFLCMGLFTVCIPFIHSLPLLMASQALSGVGRGVSFPVLMALSIRHMPSNKKATAMGFFQAIYGLGMFLGPVFLGWVGDFFNLNEGFMAIGLLGCATALLSQVLIKHFLIVKNVVSFR